MDETKIPEDQRTDKVQGIHRLPLIAAAGLAVLSVLVVFGSSGGDKRMIVATLDHPIEERSLLFRDAKGGKIIVADADTKLILATYDRGEGAFIRQSMRAMVHARRQVQGDQKMPYRLMRSAENKLAIVDPISGQFIKLNAFGAVATSSFARFLPSYSKESEMGKVDNQHIQKGA